MTSKNNRAPLLYYIKLCASFQIHRWIQTGVTVRKRSFRVKKIGDFLSLVTLKFDGWPWKTIGYLFYTTSSFVHHFKAMSEFKLKLQPGNAQFGSKSMFTVQKRPKSAVFFSRVTLNDGWPWKTIEHLSWATSSIVHHFIIIWEFKLELYSPETGKLGFDLCDLDLWPLALTFCVDLNSALVITFDDDTMMGT